MSDPSTCETTVACQAIEVLIVNFPTVLTCSHTNVYEINLCERLRFHYDDIHRCKFICIDLLEIVLQMRA